MNDKELLKLAAKAIGISPVYTYEKRRNCLRIGTSESYSIWKPLNDDGDALRLAVGLSIFDIPLFSHFRSVETFNRNNDSLSVTRRAIVRAAAEIGKLIP